MHRSFGPSSVPAPVLALACAFFALLQAFAPAIHADVHRHAAGDVVHAANGHAANGHGAHGHSAHGASCQAGHDGDGHGHGRPAGPADDQPAPSDDDHGSCGICHAILAGKSLAPTTSPAAMCLAGDAREEQTIPPSLRAPSAAPRLPLSARGPPARV